MIRNFLSCCICRQELNFFFLPKKYLFLTKIHISFRVYIRTEFFHPSQPVVVLWETFSFFVQMNYHLQFLFWLMPEGQLEAPPGTSSLLQFKKNANQSHRTLFISMVFRLWNCFYVDSSTSHPSLQSFKTEFE